MAIYKGKDVVVIGERPVPGPRIQIQYPNGDNAIVDKNDVVLETRMQLSKHVPVTTVKDRVANELDRKGMQDPRYPLSPKAK